MPSAAPKSAPRPEPRPDGHERHEGGRRETRGSKSRRDVRRDPRPRQTWQVGTPEGPDGVNLGRRLLRLLRGPSLVGALAYGFKPSDLADGTLDALSPEQLKRLEAQSSQVPEVPEWFDHLDLKANGKAFEFRPTGDPIKWRPLRGPINPLLPEGWPAPDEVGPIPLAAPAELPRQPEIPELPRRQVTPVSPRAVPGELIQPSEAEQSKTGDLPAPMDELHISASPEGEIRVEQKTRRKWNRRRRDGKMARWYKFALLSINKTWGTVSEAWDLADAIAWNSYATVNGKRVSAMTIENGNYLAVAQGIGRGDYMVDPVGTAIDVAIMQATDTAIGRFSRAAQNEANRAGWESPVGIGAGPAI